MSRLALNRTRPHSIASYANQSYLTSYLKSYLKKKRTVWFFLNVGPAEGSNIVAYYGILRHCYHYHMVNLHYS